MGRLNKKEFGELLRADMKKRGITFKKLSDLTEISLKRLSYITRGEAKFYLDQLERIALVFDYPESILPYADEVFAPNAVAADTNDPEKRPKPYCKTCDYLWQQGDQLYCLFCHDTGEPRGCKPVECKDKGRWVPATGRKRGGEIPWIADISRR